MTNCIFRPIGTDPGDINDNTDMCLAAGIGGRIVPEEFQINNVCQDPNDINIVYFELGLKGIFLYEPHLIVRFTDSHGTPQALDISQRHIFDYKASSQSPSSFPLDTSCGALSFLMAYDVGRSIPNFASLTELEFIFTMNGTFDVTSFDGEILQQVQTLFESSNPTDSIVLVKGISPEPYALYFDETTGQLKLQYAGIGDIPCTCDIECINLSEQGVDLNICDDEIQELNIDSSSIVGDPTNIALQFTDPIGNVTNITHQLLHQVQPRKLGVARMQTSGDHVQLTVFFATINTIALDSEKLQYQIWRYDNNTDNVKMIQDWSTKKWTTYFDTTVRSNHIYGYTVRFRGEFGEVSLFSEWKVTDIIVTDEEGGGVECGIDFGTILSPNMLDLDLGTFGDDAVDCDLGVF